MVEVEIPIQIWMQIHMNIGLHAGGMITPESSFIENEKWADEQCRKCRNRHLRSGGGDLNVI